MGERRVTSDTMTREQGTGNREYNPITYHLSPIAYRL
jgi:hypothetical protein